MKSFFIIYIILSLGLAFADSEDLSCQLSTSYIAPEVAGEDVPRDVKIIFYLEDYDYVTVCIKSGEKIIYTMLKDHYERPGLHNLMWNGKDTAGNIVKNGDYTIEIGTRAGLKKDLDIRVTDLVAKISFPVDNSLVRADVPVWGLACGKDSKEFKLEYGEGINPESWILINNGDVPITKDVRTEDLSPEKQPLKGNLGTWETGLRNYYYKDYSVDLKGTYTLRLVVRDKEGNIAEDKKTVEVGNVITNVFGGVVESTDGKVNLTFAEHSLYVPFLVVSIKPVEDINIDLTQRLIGKIYEFRPAGTRFSKQGLLEMPYDGSHNEDKLGIYVSNGKDEWEYLDSAIDKENKKLIAKIDYFPKPRMYCAVFCDISRKDRAENEDLEDWHAWKGTNIERVSGSPTYLKLVNNDWGGYYGVDVNTKGFDAKEYPILEFDYKISSDVKINILIRVGGRWYDIVFTDDPKQYLRINMKRLGEIVDIKIDNNWHHASFDLLDGLLRYTRESFVEKIILADFDSTGYMELKPGMNPKGASYYIDNFQIRKLQADEVMTKKEISQTEWQIGEDDGSNDDLAYERFEGLFKDSDTDDDFYIGDPEGELERAVAYDDQITNVYFSLNESEAKDRYIFYADVMDCDLRTNEYVKFGIYINDNLIDVYTCYLKKGQLYAVPIERGLKAGQNKITIKWLEGGNWVSWDYVALKPLKYKEEIKITIEKDKIYVNGELFLVKGIGYSPFRPGEMPWSKRPSLQTLENDFRLIKEAGFNAIRTWMPLTEEELLMARKYGLLVLQGIWLDPIADPLRTTKFEKLSPFLLGELKQLVRRSSRYDNILLCLVGNEIPVENVYQAGLNRTEKIFKIIKKITKKVNPKSRISFANWPQVLFLDNSVWDMVTYNVYPYYPVTISHSLGYYGFLESIKNMNAVNRPFIVTEYGMSVSKRGAGNFGYGGNTLEQQSEALPSMYDDIIQAGTNGGCLFEWNDEWWKNHDFIGDADSHNNEPEEWFGILGIEGTVDDYKENLRPAYYAIKEFNQAVIVKPKRYKFYKKTVPIKLYTTDDVYSVRYKVDDSLWRRLKHISPHWWKAIWKSKDTEIQLHILKMEAMDKDGKVICEKQFKFWSGLDFRTKEPHYHVTIACRDNYICGGKPELINVLFKVVDENNKPVKEAMVKYSFYETRLWEQVSGEKVSDEEGQVSVDYYIKEPGYIIVAAGVDYVYRDFKKRYGNIRFIEVATER